MASTNFVDLEVWKAGRALRSEIFEFVKRFPKDEKYRLSDQLIRSSRSVCANIAEGHGRYHFQENIQFCRMSRGSLSETLDHLICAKDCGYLDEGQFSKLEQDVARIGKMLNGYINFLSKKKSES